MTRPPRWLWVALLPALAVGCGIQGPGSSDDDDDDTGSSSGSGSGAGSTSGSSSSSSGIGGGSGVDPNAPAVFAVGNVDDDNSNGQADWADGQIDGDNDIASLWLPEDLGASVAPGDELELTLEGDTNDIRVWLNGQVILGAPPGGGPVTAFTLAGADAGAELQVELAYFRVRGLLRVRHLVGGAEVSVLELPIMAAPLIQNHHLQPAERVQVVQTNDNGALMQSLQSTVGGQLTVIQSSDRWIQDELEWATATAPGMRLDIAMDSIRDRELDYWVKGTQAPNVQPITWGNGHYATTEDKFGNLEATPPVTVGGVHYPFGRIYYGDNGQVGPNPDLKAFLDAQAIQAPIKIDVGWLCVGHVDEFLAFIPDPSSPKGFKLLYADVTAAWAVLESMSPSTSINKYGSSHGYSSVGDLLADNALRALNDDIQQDKLNPTLDQLKNELGLDESDVVRVPSLFERISYCSYSYDYLETAALIPGLVNLTVVDVEGGPIRLYFPDPFMRPSGASQSSDPIINALTAALPSGYELHFVDDWYSYHTMMGEVHCGTNVTRTPTANWWTDGQHLLGGGQ